jgi:hypothetical protein
VGSNRSEEGPQGRGVVKSFTQGSLVWKNEKTARKSSKIRNFRKFKDNCLSGSKRKNILILSEVHLALGNTSRMHVLGGTGSGEIGAPYL